jgi:hypothetical protein
MDDYATLIKILTPLKNKEYFYDFNPYEMISPKMQNIFIDGHTKVKKINGYKKRFYNNDIIFGVTEYDALYPENFYSVWELLKIYKIIDNKINKFAFIDIGVEYSNYETPLGHMEAAMKYAECYTKYEKNLYVRIPLGKMKKQKENFEHIYKFQIHNFLKYEFNKNIYSKLFNYYKNNKFDFAFSYCTDKYRNITSLLILKCGGSSIICIKNMFNQLNIYSKVTEYFCNFKLIKIASDHPLEPRCYLILNSFKGLNSIKQFFDITSQEKIELNNSFVNKLQKLKIKYRTNLIKFYSTIKYNNIKNLSKQSNVSKNNNIVQKKDVKTIQIDYAIKWAKKYDMKIKSMYDKNSKDDFNHIYLKYSFENYNLCNIECFDLNKTYAINVDQLHSIKRSLNKRKRIIDTKEQFVNNDIDKCIIDWNKLTDCIDIYKNLKNILSWKFNTEMVTNAWIKFYEIIVKENLIVNKHELKTFHLCEAPGSFILSINHYIKTSTDQNICKYIWYAQSLNPYNKSNVCCSSMLNDQFKLMKLYPKRWLFGSSNDGDITNKETIMSYKDHNKLYNLDLITGDGGVRVPQNMFNEQESVVGHVNFGQVFTMLYLLPKDKKCIFKTFIPFAEPFTISLLYLLVTLFNSVKIVKPKSSHPSSSEVYVICDGYYGYESIPILICKKMIFLLSNFDINNPIFSLEQIDSNFIEELITCSKYFSSQQEKSIERSLYYRYVYYYDYLVQDRLSDLRNIAVDNWIKDCNIKTISNKDKII